MYTRAVERHINDYCGAEGHKIFFIWGPRRSGKTTILKKISAERGAPLFNFDVLSDREKFVPERAALQAVAKSPLVLIDEVQNYPEATRALKILYDEFNVKIIATGSSELRRKSKEFDSLAGRFSEYYCLPFSVEEIRANTSLAPHQQTEWQRQLLAEQVVYGAYPEVQQLGGDETEKINRLQNLLDTYVLKDIIDIYNLRNAKLAKDLLTKISLQIGQEVSVRELANSLGANVSTVANYIEIFIKNYVLVPLPAFKTNQRRAISEHRKLYFLDLGLRNSLIKDFRPLELRPDKGAVFENFILAEMFKKVLNERRHFSFYFYREYGGKEIDFVLEDYKKNYRCFESKYTGRTSPSVFPLPHTFDIISQQNYFDLIESLKG